MIGQRLSCSCDYGLYLVASGGVVDSLEQGLVGTATFLRFREPCMTCI